MTTQHSKNHTLLIGKETTFGTAVTPTKDIGLIQNFSPADKREIQKVYSTGSRETQCLVLGKLDLSWDFEINLQHGRIFEYLLGSVSHTQTTSDWKHTFDIATNLPSFTIEDSFNSTTDSVFMYAGSKLSEGTISVDTDGLLTFKGTGISKSVDVSGSSASSSVISSLCPLHFKHTTLKSGTAGSETSVGKLQKYSLNIKNDVEGIYSAGNIDIQEAIAKNLEITFDFDIAFEDTTEYQKFLGGTTPQTSPSSFSFVFNSNNGVTLGSGRREFNAQLTGVNYEEVGTPVNVGDIVIQSFKGSATGLGTDKIYYVDNISETAF